MRCVLTMLPPCAVLSASLAGAITTLAKAAEPTTRPAANTLCERVATKLRDGSATRDATGHGFRSLLDQIMTLQSLAPAPSARIGKLVELDEVRAINYSEVGPDFEQLPGTDVYMATTIGGTAHCEQMVFIEAKAGRPARVLAEPASYGASGLCWYAQGNVGRVFGQPAYVEEGTTGMSSLDYDIRITPWRGTDWGHSCRVSLKVQPSFTRGERFCADQALCPQADAVAVPIARAYYRFRAKAADGAQFEFGAPPSASAASAVTRAKNDLTDLTSVEKFPTFGAMVVTDGWPGYGYSYSGFQYFALMLGGHEYVAAIGHAGIGWRESDRTLFAVYDQSLTPLVGFAIEQTEGRLTEVIVENDEPRFPNSGQ
jgi:hypothetical protein